MTIETLTKTEFNSTAEIVQALNNFTCKVMPDTERIYILDKTNPNRHKSREFEVKESADNTFFLKEIK